MKKVKSDVVLIKEILIYVAIMIVVLIIRFFFFAPIRVNGTSMNTTLHNKEIMILSKIDYVINDIERFDIVVIDYHGERLIKRVIGLPGETLKYQDDVLYINDEKVEEYFKNQSTRDFDIKDLNYDVIPKDCYFVLGDNRGGSSDSRIIGCIPRDMIMGSANLVIWPLKDFGMKK